MVNRALGSPISSAKIATSKNDMLNKVQQAMGCKSKEEEKKEREDSRNANKEHMAADARKDL